MSRARSGNVPAHNSLDQPARHERPILTVVIPNVRRTVRLWGVAAIASADRLEHRIGAARLYCGVPRGILWAYPTDGSASRWRTRRLHEGSARQPKLVVAREGVRNIPQSRLRVLYRSRGLDNTAKMTAGLPPKK